MSDPRSVNLLFTIDERNVIRQSIAKAEEELQRLSNHRKKVTDDLSQLKKMFVIHRILPRETISHIFPFLRAEKVSIPHSRRMTPPQIIVSHVCSKWREIALATPALWSDVKIVRPQSNHWVHVALELLFDRAGTRGVNLALQMEELGSNKMGEIFYDIVLPLHVKKLQLTLPLSALENLSQKSNDIIANIDEIALSFKFTSPLVQFTSDPNQVSITHQFLNKIRSVTVLERGSQRSFVQRFDLQNLPWAQMRHLCCNISLTLPTISDILRQSPLLDVCGIHVEQDDETEPTTVLTLPQLRIFHIIVDHKGPQRDQDKVLRSFKCPNLTDFRLEIPHWTPETHKIIENHYNLHQLLRFDTSRYPYPISKVLFGAPMLQELILFEKVFMDGRGLQGVASGKLGRCLTSLGFEGNFDEKRVLDMVACRQRHVKQVVEASRSWQDQQISGIKWIFLLKDDAKDNALVEELKGKRDELEELGVIVYESTEPVDSHPLCYSSLSSLS